MNYSHEVESMCTVQKGPNHGPAPIPEEGRWVKAYDIKDISGLSHGVCLNTDLVCDAINVAMRELFQQLVYGRSQTAFSEDGLPVGAGLEDLGKGLRSQVGTMYSTKAKGVRYMEMAEGYVTSLALDENDEVIGYRFVKLGKMLEDIRHGVTPNEAYEKNMGQYGRYDGAAKYIDPREE